MPVPGSAVRSGTCCPVPGAGADPARRPGRRAAAMTSPSATAISRSSQTSPRAAVTCRRRSCASYAAICPPWRTCRAGRVRVAAELIIDTGRRPDEICALRWDCLEYDEPGHQPVLVYFNHKAARQGRRLPIAQATAGLIIAQKTRARELFPGTSLGELKLLPAAYANPHGRRAITESHFGAGIAHGSRACRRCCAPMAPSSTRRASFPTPTGIPTRSGTPMPGFRSTCSPRLMDHLSLDTTRGYYTVGESRCRDAVDKVTALQFDRHGNRIWRDARALLDSEHARRAIGEVAVPTAPAPSRRNVQAARNACPYRFRCAAATTSAPTSPTCPTCTPTSTICCATGNECSPPPRSTSGRAPKRPRPRTKSPGSGSSSAGSRTAWSDLTAAEREQIGQAVAIVRRHRTVTLGMPRMRQALPDIRPERTA